jgi:pilus assembly protein Flp/PilA
MKNLIAWFKDEEGQGMVEYALIIGLISIVAIVILASLGNKIKNKFTQIDGNLT